MKTRYGPEWAKEMMKHSKAQLIDKLRVAWMGEQKSAAPCSWRHDEDNDKWDANCGAAVCFIDGGPTENQYRFCPGCGRRIEIATP